MRKVKTDKDIYKVIRGCQSDIKNKTGNSISERLNEVCSVLKDLNINTVPKLLVDARLQRVEYRWYRTGFRTRTLWKNIYVAIKSIDKDNIVQEESFVQNHEFGSKVYQLYRGNSSK